MIWYEKWLPIESHRIFNRILKTIYSSLIESYINYCLVLWGTNYDRIFKLTKKLFQLFHLHISNHTPVLYLNL